jgi:alkanesulfonate monooxygenase SsuD/methylene tetrahydromethanopterin reductase-like flavin-dependent oxidoreductase (luciferase family)
MANQDNAVKFSMFDWLDESGRGYAHTYDERLRLLEYVDRAGYYSYLLAEHHGTSLSTTPSPSLFLCAAAQRTQHIRLGALTWLLPLYNPLRLLEELCMLDQMSHGRLELGISRGSSPHEAKRHGVSAEESRQRFDEVLKLLIMGFTTGELNFQGNYYQYDGLKTRFRPYQKPYPPIWCPTSSEGSIPWIAANGFGIALSLLHSPTLEKVAQSLQQYRDEFHAHRNDPGRLNAHAPRPEIAFTTHVYVADTDEQARAEGGAAYVQFHENFTRRYVEIGQGDKYAHRPGFEQLVKEHRILCGSPDTVRKALQSHFALTGANHFVGAFTFGSLSFEQTQHSLELFSKEVMPAFNTIRLAA